MKLCGVLLLATVSVGLSLSYQKGNDNRSSLVDQDVVRVNTATLIAKGVVAPLHAYPYQTSLQQLDQEKGWVHRCAGSIIGSNKILTTARCVEFFFNGNLAEYRAMAGTNNIEDPESGVQIRSFVDGYMHPGYSKFTRDYDYFVAYVNVPFDFHGNSSIVRPIELLSAGIEPRGICTAAGWGETDGGTYSPQLLHVNLTMIPSSTCQEQYESIGISITQRMICAGDDTKGICMGDYGGPLVCDGILGGVASGRIGLCGDSRYPSVFSNVAVVIDWIESV